MADEPEPPDAKPVPRRRAARKPADSSPRRKPAAKVPAGKIDDAAAEAIRAPVTAVTPAAKKGPDAVKPRSTNRATPRVQGKKGKTTPDTRVPEAARKAISGWGTAAIAGGLGAAAAVALLSLRSSTPRKKGIPMTKQAHQPDGTDSSASFAAGIADENTVPDAAPENAVVTGGAHQPDGTDSSAAFKAGMADEQSIPD